MELLKAQMNLVRQRTHSSINYLCSSQNGCIFTLLENHFLFGIFLNMTYPMALEEGWREKGNSVRRIRRASCQYGSPVLHVACATVDDNW